MDADPQLDQTDRQKEHFYPQMRDRPAYFAQDIHVFHHSFISMQPNKMTDMLEHVISAQNCG